MTSLWIPAVAVGGAVVAVDNVPAVHFDAAAAVGDDSVVAAAAGTGYA